MTAVMRRALAVLQAAMMVHEDKGQDDNEYG